MVTLIRHIAPLARDYSLSSPVVLFLPLGYLGIVGRATFKTLFRV